MRLFIISIVIILLLACTNKPMTINYESLKADNKIVFYESNSNGRRIIHEFYDSKQFLYDHISKYIDGSYVVALPEANDMKNTCLFIIEKNGKLRKIKNGISEKSMVFFDPNTRLLWVVESTNNDALISVLDNNLHEINATKVNDQIYSGYFEISDYQNVKNAIYYSEVDYGYYLTLDVKAQKIVVLGKEEYSKE
jgi:hypothetical protein